jgi:hypothetical protein
MIILCPHCGRPLSKTLEDGISSCDNCFRVFDTASYCKVLSASWVARRWNWDEASIQAKFNLTDEETKIVSYFVIEQQYCHDDFVEVLKDYPSLHPPKG